MRITRMRCNTPAAGTSENQKQTMLPWVVRPEASLDLVTRYFYIELSTWYLNHCFLNAVWSLNRVVRITNMGCFGADNDTNRVDEETAVRGVQVDFRDDRWIIDLELDNIISNISEIESWTTSFRRALQGAHDNGQLSKGLGKVWN